MASRERRASARPHEKIDIIDSIDIIDFIGFIDSFDCLDSIDFCGWPSLRPESTTIDRGYRLRVKVYGSPQSRPPDIANGVDFVDFVDGVEKEGGLSCPPFATGTRKSPLL